MTEHFGRFVLVPAMVLMLAPVSLRAQKSDNPPHPDAKHQFVPLKHVNATEAAKAVKEFVRGSAARIVADERTNSLIILAVEDELKLIKDIVAKLDMPGAPVDGDDASVQVFALKHADSGSMLNVLKSVFGNSGARLAMDPASNAIIVSGDKNAKMVVGALLEKLDRAAAREEAGREMQVRVVWLAGLPRGSDASELPKPPDDMKEVVGELAKIGVRDPILISQAVVNAAANGEFNVQGTATLGSEPCSLMISGVVSDQSGASPSLRINIEAISTAPQISKNFPKTSPICRIQTVISAPPGHPVVLGVTPTERMTSVFVVQLMPRKSDRQPKR